jgi:glycosyltransferase involved in cell wall biosynthesis
MEMLPKAKRGPRAAPFAGASSPPGQPSGPAELGDTARTRGGDAVGTTVAVSESELSSGEVPPTGPLGLSVIIPVFNEQDTVVEVIQRVLAQPLVTEVLVVNDGSADRTHEAIASAPWPAHVRLLTHEQNQGKGAAIRTGITAATQAVIIVQDADFEYDPADYPLILQPILDGRADVVYGSRFLTPRPYAFWLDLANRLLTVATNVLYGAHLSDMETCYKAFRAEVLKGITIRSNRFDFEPEITAKMLRQHRHVVEVPISYQRRGYASGKKIRLRDAFAALRALLRFRFSD